MCKEQSTKPNAVEIWALSILKLGQNYYAMTSLPSVTKWIFLIILDHNKYLIIKNQKNAVLKYRTYKQKQAKSHSALILENISLK